MDKRILEEYIDACEVIRETEAEIRKLEDKKSITANETVMHHQQQRGRNSPRFPPGLSRPHPARSAWSPR